MQLTVLDPLNSGQDFPSVDRALSTPNGLLAVGGCLSVKRLLKAYRHGIFPWYNPDEPILWWSPDPRLVLFPDKLTISHSLLKTIRKKKFTVTYDEAFAEVIAACAEARQDSTGTWITDEINSAYNELHRIGIAHSAEAWLNGKLVGGLYGLAIGQVFFGESMFHRETNASKVAFVTLVEQLTGWNYQLIDCQVHTSHLVNFGAEDIGRAEFVRLLEQFCNTPSAATAWQNQ